VSESRFHNNLERGDPAVEQEVVVARSLGSTAVTGHEADEAATSAVAEQHHTDTSAGDDVGLADPGENDMTAPIGSTNTSAVRTSGGRILMGDLIGWDRVHQLASDRAKARRLAAELRRASQSGRPSVLLSQRNASGRSSI
jgi:hypothetical protein